MKKILQGLARFQSDVYPHQKALFKKLARGQKPLALFLTCADSRIDPSLITQTEPGELFICRNAGNIVPPHGGMAGGMTASIEYAAAALEVPDIIICGHSHCGAMRGVMYPETTKGLPHITSWLTYAQAALHVVDATSPNLSEEARMEALIQQNVLVQRRHVETHPHVAARLASNSIRVHAWVYDIESGTVASYDDKTRRFENLTPDAAKRPTRRSA
ncbi:MAG: carbonic anhydrase [Bryobacterales bacterium]|nr:carbonic anhydrase [Bryobacterales bacterium]